MLTRNDENQRIITRYIEDELRESYLTYAMSVNTNRAIPDVRDGMKPSTRRIIYAMGEINLTSGRPYDKCAAVVGEAMKNYHPHGDGPIYDTLVGMVQDFAMRYPLIDGQGNFGCFTGQTRVRLADGSSKSFEELVDAYARGEQYFTYTVNAGRVEMAPIRAPRLTKKNAPVVKVTLDNSEPIVCTPDHRFMLRDGTYGEAEHLRPDDKLMPFYSRLYAESDPNLRSYEQIYQPSENTWEFAHHLADEYNINSGVYPRSAGRVRHHQDLNKLNNDPRNIMRMQWADHRRLHIELLDELWSDANFRQQMRTMLADQWNDPEFREKTIAAIRERNRRFWRDPAYRARHIAALKKLWEDEEFRERILRRALETNVLRCGTPEQKANIIQGQREALKRMWQDPTYRALRSELMREVSNRLWAAPEHRAYISERARRQWTEEYRAQKSAEAKAQWANPEYRAKMSHLSAERWRDPEYRAKFKGHFASNGQKTIRSRFLTIAKRALERDGELTPDGYERERRATGINTIISFANGLARLFDGDLEGAKTAARSHIDRLNHRVVSVEPAGYADVYDLTVDGTHNFALATGIFVHNSIDDDPPGAMRYTECRLAAIADEMLADVHKNTVDFQPNYKDSTTEPTVLPARLPNLIVNGTTGIGVGYLTRIPPHNLSEVVDGLILLLENPAASIQELMKCIPGPDFPTAGLIVGRSGIRDMYTKGRGSITVRAKAVIERAKGGKEHILITEIPYQIKKNQLLEKMYELVANKTITGISDIRDESDRNIRILVELKRGEIAQVILNQLYKHSQMQTNYSAHVLCLVDGLPQVLSLKEILQAYLDHRREVIRRRTQFELDLSERRAHILEGYRIALNNIEEVIEIVQTADSPQDARDMLIANYALSEVQANEILTMTLRQLTGLERQKINNEYADLIERIEELRAILESEILITNLMKEELLELKTKYGDDRRTEIVEAAKEFEIEDLIADEEMVVMISHEGYIKRMPITTYRRQHRGGIGVIGMGTKDGDFLEHLFVASAHQYILFFTDRGKCYWLKVFEIPEGSRTASGRAIVNLLRVENDEKITAFVPVREFDSERFVFMATEKGIVKKCSLDVFSNPYSAGIIAINLDEGDKLIGAQLTEGKHDIILVTKLGMSIRFNETDVRSMGRTAMGVRGTRLADEDIVVGMVVAQVRAELHPPIDESQTLLIVTENGYGKRTALDEYRLQGRGGKGVIAIKTSTRNGVVVAVKMVSDGDELIVISSNGMVTRMAVNDIRTIGRNTQGVRLMSLHTDETVVDVGKITAEDDEE